jgi:hypothetical protein
MWPSAFYGRSLAIPALFFCACMLCSFAERDVAQRGLRVVFFAFFARLSGGDERGDERKVLSTTNPSLPYSHSAHSAACTGWFFQ